MNGLASLQKHIPVLGIVTLCLLFFVTRSFPFREQSIPLGYDPGLYKSMWLAYQQLGNSRDFTQLPIWIQHMYEPLVGMRGALFGSFGITFSDRRLTWGWVFVSGLLPLGVWFLAREFGKTIPRYTIVLVIGSFTQFHVFRRGYRKQLIGIFFVCLIIAVRTRSKRAVSIPLIAGLFLVNRPASALLLLVAGVGIIVKCRREKPIRIGGIVESMFWSACLSAPILYFFRETQIVPMREPFFASVDLPDTGEDADTGGRFLTIIEYLRLSRPLLVLALGGIISCRREEQYRWLRITTLVLLVRVGAQLFFFQRMIGYLDIFLLMRVGILCDQLRKKSRGWKCVVIAAVCRQYASLLYRGTRTWRPIIEANEFAVIQQVSAKLPSDAVILTAGIWYSPWIQGRSDREVIAPGLFDTNRWGALGDERYTKWTTASVTEKCQRLDRDYPEFRDRPLYIRQGTKQPADDLAGGCFELVGSAKGRSRWKRK